MNDKIQKALFNIEERIDRDSLYGETLGDKSYDITEYLVEIVTILANQNEELNNQVSELKERVNQLEVS